MTEKSAERDELTATTGNSPPDVERAVASGADDREAPTERAATATVDSARGRPNESGHRELSRGGVDSIFNPATRNAIAFRRTPDSEKDALEFELVVPPGSTGELLELRRRHPTQRQHVEVVSGRLVGEVLALAPPSSDTESKVARRSVSFDAGKPFDVPPGLLLQVHADSTDTLTRVVVRYEPAHDIEGYLRRGYALGARIADDVANGRRSDGRRRGSEPPGGDRTTADASISDVRPPSTEPVVPDGGGQALAANGRTDGRTSTMHDDGEPVTMTSLYSQARTFGGLVRTYLDTASDETVDRRALGSDQTWGTAFRDAWRSAVGSWNYLWQDESKWHVLLVGGAVAFVFSLLMATAPYLAIVPAVYLVGYFARVCRRGISNRPALPQITDWRALGPAGVMPTLVLALFAVAPIQILGAVLSVLLPGLGFSIVNLAARDGRTLSVILLVAGYVQLVAFLLYIQDRDQLNLSNVRSLPGRILPVLTSKAYAATFVLITGIQVLTIVATQVVSGVEPLLVYPLYPLLFGAYVVIFHLLGSHIGARWTTIPAVGEPAPSGEQYMRA